MKFRNDEIPDFLFARDVKATIITSLSATFDRVVNKYWLI